MRGVNILLLTFIFFAFGYFSGSILFARLYGTLFNKDIIGSSNDKNPGAANAFINGGFFCGTLTLIGDLFKGFIPVFLFLYLTKNTGPGIALVLAAPVLGHNYSVFYRFTGGKGIAVSFGCLLGLLPYAVPVLILAAVYITLSVAVVISPNYYRSITAYTLVTVIAFFAVEPFGIKTGMGIISALIIIKHLASREERQKLRFSVPLCRFLKRRY